MNTPLQQLIQAAREIQSWAHLDDAREWRSDLAKLEAAVQACEQAAQEPQEWRQQAALRRTFTVGTNSG